ncbi:hypothetical protein QBC38DRAFT_547749 [Podospora fimiseda]|uniref:BTB domain-containing protein n=1 Tax=Podospora fimiseda TaxID=252190 RepID=A0AAN7BJB8_9PEZI|nr:hypothetical protein QBC38DRAFT_547749 [Podospora fimiseda]
MSKRFRVDSRALKRGFHMNKVFQEMLSENFKIVSLPDEDPDAFLILLNIMHGRVCQVPVDLDLDSTEQVLMLADQYQAINLVEPWLNACENDSAEFTIQKLHVAWLAKDKSSYTRIGYEILAKSFDQIIDGRPELVVRTRYDDPAQPRMLSELLDGILPPEIIERIIEERKSLNHMLLDYWSRALLKLEFTQDKVHYRWSDKVKAEQCEDDLIDCLNRGLQQYKSPDPSCGRWYVDKELLPLAWGLRDIVRRSPDSTWACDCRNKLEFFL